MMFTTVPGTCQRITIRNNKQTQTQRYIKHSLKNLAISSGGLDQLADRALSMREVPGSKPGFSKRPLLCYFALRPQLQLRNRFFSLAARATRLSLPAPATRLSLPTRQAVPTIQYPCEPQSCSLLPADALHTVPDAGTRYQRDRAEWTPIKQRPTPSRSCQCL